MRTTLVALVTMMLSMVAAADPAPYKVPLYRRSNGVVSAAGKALDSGVLAGTVHIGNPPQEFTMAFDTSSGYSWVRGSRCKSENCLDRCTYYARRSNTSQPTGKKFSVQYGDDACVDTHVYLDTVEFSGIQVQDMPFGGAYRMSGFADGLDGYLGLGPSVNLNTSKLSVGNSGLSKRDMSSSAFVPNAYQQGAGVGSSQFGMYTTDNGAGFDQNGGAGGGALPPPPVKRSNTQESPAGYLVLGGIDTNAIDGNMTYVPLASESKGNWDVCIKHAQLNHALALPQLDNAIASISTSNPTIVMPACQADEFKRKYGFKFYQKSKTYSVKCSEIKDLPPLELVLEDKTITLPASYWTREIDADRDCCEVLLSKGSSSKDWILGVPFTNAFYTTFDSQNNQVGLAIKKGNKNDQLKISDA
ncbi:unnamed protein product [Absidia cylindrospora]